MRSPIETSSLCPVCKQIVTANIYEEASQVYMSKECPSHGLFKSLICSDVDFYLPVEKYNRPGKKYMINQYAVTNYVGCPNSCGLCPEHQQHTCVGILEVTKRCDQGCPICYASSTKNGEDSTLEELISRLKFLSRCEKEKPTLVITGGEPTLRSDLVDLVSEARELGYTYMSLSTNGLHLAKNPILVRELAKAGLKELNLSFDSVDDSVYELLRGHKLYSLKKQAVEVAKQAGLKVVLNVTLVKNVNDKQIGAIIEFAKKMRVDGIVFSPVAFVGRFCAEFFDPLNRITIPDVIKSIQWYTNGEVSATDFLPSPCADTHCTALTYVFNDQGHFIPLTRYCDVSKLDSYGEKPKDQEPIISAVLDKLLSMSSKARDECLEDMGKCCSAVSFIDKVMGIQVHAFQDPWTFDLKRCKKCCLHVVLNDKLIPFCVYNNLYR